MADKILTFNGKMIAGPSGTGMVIVPGPPTMTIRFKFYYDTYYPYSPLNEQSVKGTWSFIESGTIDQSESYSIWDWTYTGANASSAFYNRFGNNSDLGLNDTEILNLTCTSEITDVSNLFNGCTKITGSFYNIYTILSNMNVRHTDCFKFCGAAREYSADLARIPEDWGGMKPLQGRGIKLGDYIWDNEPLSNVVIPGMIEIDSNEDYESGTIGYYEYGGYVYFTPAAILYMIEHPEVLPAGWHIPTHIEAENTEDYLYHFSDLTLILSTRGNNGFNVVTEYNSEYDETHIVDGEGYLEYDEDKEKWQYYYSAWHQYEYDYRDSIDYIIDRGYIYIGVCYSGGFSVSDRFYPDETGELYPVRLVRNHD